MKHQNFRIKSGLAIALILGIVLGLNSCTPMKGCPGAITKVKTENAGRS